MTTRLAAGEVVEWARKLRGLREKEKDRLDQVFYYLRNPDLQTSINSVQGYRTGPMRWLAKDVPDDVRRLADMSRVNMVKLVVNSTVQVLYVDGYRAPKQADEDPSWRTWQLNRMGARQIGVHRSALSYGSSYVTVLPGDPVPVLRGVSPRKMTAVYAEDSDWPELALERRRSVGDSKRYRLYDADHVWTIVFDEKDEGRVSGPPMAHGAGHVPIVRFLNEVDDDGYISGEVEPLIPLQDQINVTTFGLLVAQHYAAFRQRYIIGWAAGSEENALKASAKKLWTFEDPEITVGEFQQTDLSGYINSREASLRHLATVSQTPAHELLGQLVNLSAEALAAAESGHQRKVVERQTSFGESWDMVFELSAALQGEKVDEMANVRWRDTEARSLSQVADALGKLVAGLGVPPEELWEKIPGVTQQEIDRWKATAAKADAITQLTSVLERQAEPEQQKGF